MGGRKSASVAAATGGGRNAIWVAIRELQEFEVKDLPAGIPKTTINTYLTGLVNGGYLKRIKQTRFKDGRWQPGRYKLVRDVGPVAPRVRRDGKKPITGAVQDQLWRTMKIRKEFTAKDLAIHASTKQVRVAVASALTYCHYLARAGYLAVVHAGTKGAPAVYRFLASRNTGPRPPIVQKIKQVFDPNTNEVVWTEEPAHD